MDWLRSCYSCKMQINAEGEEPRVIDVNWYWADDDAPIMPYANYLYSRNWDLEWDACLKEWKWSKPRPFIGELNTDRVYRDGNIKPQLRNGVPFGAEGLWENGCLPDSPLPEIDPETGECLACKPTPPPPPPNPILFSCVNTPDGLYESWRVTIAGATGGGSVYNGDWDLEFSSLLNECWRTSSVPGGDLYAIWGTQGLTRFIDLYATDGGIFGNTRFYYRLIPSPAPDDWGLVSPRTLSRLQNQVGGMPLTVQLFVWPVP